MCQINTSIVLYHNNQNQLKKAIYSFLNKDIKVKLYLIDNSLNDDLRELEKLDTRIEYIYNNANLGYGTAHNIAMQKSIEGNVKYHLVLNPDVYFNKGIIKKLYEFMELNSDVGLVMPKIVYPDGNIQFLAKLLPTPLILFFRRFMPFKKLKEKINEKYEFRFTGYNKSMNVPCLSGCFMFLRVSALKEVGLFDENFFMYFEDTDLSRRIHKKYKTILFPKVSIYHEYRRESYKSKKLLLYHIKSAIYYFNKWGWFFDKERKIINERTLKASG